MRATPRQAKALQAERSAVLPLLADIVAEVLVEACEHQQAALREHEREMELSVKKLEAAVSALETASHVERSREPQHDAARKLGLAVGARQRADVDGRNGAPCRRAARLVCGAQQPICDEEVSDDGT